MILFRADANEQIGVGHLMRCLSVARAFANKGDELKFITADHKGDGLIKNAGFDSVCLNSEWSYLDSEIGQLKRLITDENPILLIIDSYYVTDKYLSSISDIVRTVYIDDLNSACWNVNVLINYNIFSSGFDYSGYDTIRTKLLLGPKYAPLRSEFINCPKHKIKDVTDIMVSAGGSDPERITEKIMNYICPIISEDIVFHFIVGALNPRLNDIKNTASGLKNVVLHINEPHMSELMAKCDIAISAAGTTLYELCAMGITTITYTLADNQIPAANEFDKQGIMISAGDCRNEDQFIERLNKLLLDLIKNDALRAKLSYKMQSLVDGNGASRIVEDLNNL